MQLLICKAIRARTLLMFGYGDTVRIVEPHVYGVNTAGHEVLGAWLRPGHSRTDPQGGWRNYLLDGIRDLQTLDEHFPGPRPGYNPDDPRIPTVYCRLDARASAGGGAGLDESDRGG